jgi:hypothetical protein
MGNRPKTYGSHKVRVPRDCERKQTHKRFYTAEEDAYIRKHYKPEGPGYNHNVGQQIALKLSRSAASVRARAQKLGIVAPTTKRLDRAERIASEKLKVAIDGMHTGLRVIHPGEPIPVSERTRRLAAFDPVIARCVREYDMGLAPGSLRYMGGANATGGPR